MPTMSDNESDDEVGDIISSLQGAINEIKSLRTKISDLESQRLGFQISIQDLRDQVVAAKRDSDRKTKQAAYEAERAKLTEVEENLSRDERALADMIGEKTSLENQLAKAAKAATEEAAIAATAAVAAASLNPAPGGPTSGLAAAGTSASVAGSARASRAASPLPPPALPPGGHLAGSVQGGQIAAIPSFDGSTGASEAEKWVRMIDRFQANFGWTSKQTAHVVRNKLTGQAQLFVDNQDDEFKKGTDNWNEGKDNLRTMLMNKFSEALSATTSSHAIDDLQQGPHEQVDPFYERVRYAVNKFLFDFKRTTATERTQYTRTYSRLVYNFFKAGIYSQYRQRIFTAAATIPKTHEDLLQAARTVELEAGKSKRDEIPKKIASISTNEEEATPEVDAASEPDGFANMQKELDEIKRRLPKAGGAKGPGRGGWRNRGRGRGFWRGRGWPNRARGRGGFQRRGGFRPGGPARGGGPGAGDECHNCGEKGHWIRDCPYNRGPRQSNQMSYDDYGYYDYEGYYGTGSVDDQNCANDAPFPCKLLAMMSFLSSLKLPQLDSHDPRPFVEVQIQDKAVKALIDSGSQITAIDFNLCKRFKLDKNVTVSPVPFPLVGAGGEKLDVIGQIDLEISVHGCVQQPFPVLIIRHLNSGMIIGADFLAKNQLIVDIKNEKLQMVEPAVPLRATEEITIPAGTERIMRLRAATPAKGPLYFQSMDPSISDCLIEQNHDDKASILVQNASVLDLKFSRNDIIGHGTRLSPSDIKTFTDPRPSVINLTSKSRPVDHSVVDQIPLHHLPSPLRARYKEVLMKNLSAFSRHPNEVGHCTVLPQSIQLKDPTKIVSIPPYRISPNLQPVVHAYVDNLLKTGVLQQSCSPYSSPLMLVKKASADPTKPLAEQYRLVHDYRHLNANTVRNAYPLHHLYDLLDKVSAAKVWSVIDLSSGFWNQELHPDSRAYTAFAVPGVGHLEYTRSAQGLCNSPAAFQRLLDHIVRGIPGVYVYIDDVVICSEDHESHLNILNEVLSRFKKFNLKCRPRKIQIATAEINYLGYNLSHQHGIRPGEAKIKAISEWEEPENVKQVRQFLGLCSFFRRCIPQFSSIASPLTKLTRKDSKWDSGPLPDEAKVAFARLKRKLTCRPCLSPPNFNERFYLTCDASKTGLGAVLSQFKNGVEHPVAFASRSLKESEKKYAPFHLEYLAMVWSIKHFKPYLTGKQFTLRTDHRPLLTMNKSKCQIFDRYLHELSQFDFETVYLRGDKMPADALSRKIESVSVCVPLESQINISWSQIKELQQHDKYIKALAIYKLFQSLPRNPSLKDFVERNKNALIYNDVVCKKTGPNAFAAYAPIGLQSSLLRLAHESPTAGHINSRRALSRLSRSWYWPTMKEDTWTHCTSCQVCNERNQAWTKAPIPLGRFQPARAFNERVHTDLLGMLPENSSFKYVLVMVDAYSKYLQLVPLPDKKMSTVSEAIYNHWISLFSVPKLMVSDMGKEFTGHMTKSLATRFNYPHNYSTSGHPASNGMAENSVKKVLEYVRKFVQGNTWLPLLYDLRMAHNMNLQSSINTTPFQAAFSMRPRLPGDLVFPSAPYDKSASPSHVHNELENLLLFKNEILESQAAATARMERAYNKRAKERRFVKGDKVYMVRPHTGDQFQKFQPRYKGPFVVVQVTDQNLTVVPIHAKRYKQIRVHQNNVRMAHALTQLYDVDPQMYEPPAQARTYSKSHEPNVPLFVYD